MKLEDLFSPVDAQSLPMSFVVRTLSTGDQLAFHRIVGGWVDVLVKAWFSGAKMNNAMSKA